MVRVDLIKKNQLNSTTQLDGKKTQLDGPTTTPAQYELVAYIAPHIINVYSPEHFRYSVAPMLARVRKCRVSKPHRGGRGVQWVGRLSLHHHPRPPFREFI